MKKLIIVALLLVASPALAFTFPPAPTCTMSASASTITRGQSVTITWATTNATRVTLSGDAGINPAALSGSLVQTPRGSRPYILNVYTQIPNAGSLYTQCRVQITVNQH